MRTDVKRSRSLLVGIILGVVYSLYLIMYFASVIGESAVAGSIATAIVTPHIILVVLATIFGVLGYLNDKVGFVLTAGILYSCSGVMFIAYIFFVVPMIVLTFVGYSKMKKANAMNSSVVQASQKEIQAE